MSKNLSPFSGGVSGEGDLYSDLSQIGILIVALVGLVYEIIKDKRK